MGNLFVSEMKTNFDEDKFLVIRDALSENKRKQLLNCFEKFKKNPMFKLQGNPNNSSVTNAFRLQSILYSNQYYSSDEIELNKIKKWFNFTSSELFPILDPLLDNLFSNLKVNWTVQRITTMHTFPGCPEQEIHHDSVNQMNRYFISIPLHDTPLEMGPTIFYSDHDLKNFRKTYRPKPMEDDKSGNIGYLHNLRPHNKIQFQKARRQYQLNLSDIAVHRDITFHAGGNNHTNKTRKFLFIICDKIKN